MLDPVFFRSMGYSVLWGWRQEGHRDRILGSKPEPLIYPLPNSWTDRPLLAGRAAWIWILFVLGESTIRALNNTPPCDRRWLQKIFWLKIPAENWLKSLSKQQRSKASYSVFVFGKVMAYYVPLAFGWFRSQKENNCSCPVNLMKWLHWLFSWLSRRLRGRVFKS